MKTTFTLLILALFTLGLSAQYLPLPETFEAPEADTSWEAFGNGEVDPENFLLTDNPVFNGINESDYCIQFTVVDGAETWVGAWSDAYGPLEITEDKYMMEMMVMKDVLTKCAMKLENEIDGGANVELYVENTVMDEWELLTFDFSVAIGQTFTRLVFFPDFPDTRESGSLCYIDNVGFPKVVSAKTQKMEGIRIYPNPVAERMTIRYPEMEHAVISNALGQTVRSLEFQHSTVEHIDLSGIQPGLYFITVESAGEKVTSKFIKE
jgi:hypothetical protein